MSAAPPVKKPRRKRELLNLKLTMSTIAPKLERGKKPERQPRMPRLALEQPAQPSFNSYLNQQKATRLGGSVGQVRVADVDPFAIPAEVAGYVPEAKYYSQLKNVEAELDQILRAKRMCLEETVAQPPPKVKTMLLLHIYNVHYNQKNLFTLSDPTIKVPAWALRIQGKVLLPKIGAFEDLSDTSPYIKMTHMLRKVEIAFNREQADYPDIEWNKEIYTTGLGAEQSAENKDGIEVVREGDKELDLTISVHIDYAPRQFRVRPELQSLIGLRQCTRAQAMNSLWEYVKANHLQDPEDRRVINCNRDLRLVLFVRLYSSSLGTWTGEHRVRRCGCKT